VPSALTTFLPATLKIHVPMRNCPTIITCAPASGHGKTTITAAIARYHKNQGKVVRVFKVGPDYIDPTILSRASGHPVYQLDLWMTGENQCRSLLYEAAADADLIIIEGVMGLFDGTPSCADLASKLSIPLVLIIDARAMAQTFGAIVVGLTEFRPSLAFFGVIANNVASQHHEQLLTSNLPNNIAYLGSVHKNPKLNFPQRHLGLVEAKDVENIEQHLDEAAVAISSTRLTKLPPTVSLHPPVEQFIPKLLDSVTIGIAKDAAFSFIYPANIACLQKMGANLKYFSPINDTQLPEIDALYLPGGYPELHMNELQANLTMTQAIKTHAESGKTILAECGGMLYLMDSLTDSNNNSANLCGILPGKARMQSHLVKLGMQYLDTDTGQLRGHTFHHSALHCRLLPWSYACRQNSSHKGEIIYRKDKVFASYVHWYFSSHPEFVATLFLAIPLTHVENHSNNQLIKH